MGNLILAWRKARKGKTRKNDIVEFEKNLIENLLALHYELKNKTYKPRDLTTFPLRDPKTRLISKSDFRDRVVHHAIINVIGFLFEKSFIYDSCANQIDKGNLFALRQFEKYTRKVTCNLKIEAFCLKADVKHYFEEVDHEILLSIIKRKIIDERVIWLILQILENNVCHSGGRDKGKKGMPLGNLTSQFFANAYLNELDYYVKHVLKIKYYVRYVDDFVILHESKEQLEIWKEQINNFLREKLNIELHSQKSRIIHLSKGIDFVGFRNFYHCRLVRKRNIRKMQKRLDFLRNEEISYLELTNSYQGWQAYVKWANSFSLRKSIQKEIQKAGRILKFKEENIPDLP